MRRKYLILLSGEFHITNNIKEFFTKNDITYNSRVILNANSTYKYKNVALIRIKDDDIDKYKEILKKSKILTKIT